MRTPVVQILVSKYYSLQKEPDLLEEKVNSRFGAREVKSEPTVSYTRKQKVLKD